MLLGPGPAPEFDTLTPAYIAENNDLREFGRRREEMCEKLREKAIRLAWDRGTLVEASEDNMAACNLLELLEGRDPKASKPYGSAFVSHLRTLLDDGTGVQNLSLGWSALIMREALYAVNCGRTSHFTATDDLLLCGPVPATIEAALLETVDDVDVRDSVTLFFRPMRPYTYHIARLARECSDKVTGTYARRQPLDERFVTKFLTQLDHLLHLLTILQGRIQFVLSAAATSAHALPAPFETQRQYIMKACLHALSLGWAALSLPMYTDLKRRIEELKTGTQASMGERRRTRERLELLLQQAHRTALKGARMGASCVHGAPSLAYLSHLHLEKLGSWIEILMEAVPEEDGGEGITKAEKIRELKWMEAGLKSMAWSWCSNEKLVDTIEASLSNLTIDGAVPEDMPASAPTPAESSASGLFDSSTGQSPLPAGVPPEFASFFASVQSQLPGGFENGIQNFNLDSLLSIPLFGNPNLDPSLMGGLPQDMFNGVPGMPVSEAAMGLGSGVNLDGGLGLGGLGEQAPPGGVPASLFDEGAEDDWITMEP
ncbi:Zn(2)-C6 fungal-type transcription factor [Pseudohyphozyma bogoriensis]|nr:Zn(2)-C6 fungal-type transcription factor [Pseudohyphozyma bogoriensis]